MVCPPFTTTTTLRYWFEDMGLKEAVGLGDSGNEKTISVTLFLNRMLGLPIKHQNALFDVSVGR